MSTAQTKIDVYEGILTIEVQEETIDTHLFYFD